MIDFSPPYQPAFGGFYPAPTFDSYQPYPSYGAYQVPLTPFEPYQGGSSLNAQQQPFGIGSYPGSTPFGPYPPNGLYGAPGQAPYYPLNPTSSYQPTSPYPFSTNSFSPSVGSYPSNVYNGYNPSIVSYSPTVSAVTSQNSYRPSGLIPDPFGSVAPVIGTQSYSPVSSQGSSYNPSSISSQHTYKPITIIESSPYTPSSSSSSNAYNKPGSQEGYDSIIVTAQGAYDQSPSYKPSGGYRPNGSQTQSYKPTSTNYQTYRPIVTGSIQEIPNSPTYYQTNSQNRPTFYSGSTDQVSFPREEK